MAKFTTLLLATVAALVVSTNAQVSTEPQAITIDQFDNYVSRYQSMEADYEEANMVILPYPGPHNNGTLARRAVAKPTAPKLTKEQQSILDTHNKFRAIHQAPPLKWNPKLAAFGNNWIQQCKFQHSGGPYGENLAAGYKNFKTSIEGWYGEVKNYNYNKPGFSGGVGHFTQVVWKGTKTVGCAKKYCPGSNWFIYICNYDPPGNIVGDNNNYFRKNVLPPKKK